MEEQKLLRKKKKSEGNKAMHISACTDLAEYYLANSKFTSALKEYRTILEDYKNENKLVNYAQINRRIGECFMGLQKFDDALEYFQQYLKTSKEAKNDLEIQRALAQLGHMYLSWYLETASDSNKGLLNSAYGYFIKSLQKCESLSGISHIEKQDMLARLFANLGLVKESLGEFDKALNLMNKCIKICQDNDIYEQLYRGYLSVAALFDKQNKYDDSIKNLNLAVEVAKKLRDKKVEFICAALLQKSEALIKLSDFNGAKYVLLKAYKLKTPNNEERRVIEKKLRIVAAMCYIEDQLICNSSFKELKKLYEKMGDGCCDLKNYSKAIEYYKKMLECVEKSGGSSRELATCYYSIAETYRDNSQYNEAIEYYNKELNIVKDDLKDCLNTLSKIADARELNKNSVDEVKSVYNQAIEICKLKNNKKEQNRMILRCCSYLKRVNLFSEASKMQQNLSETILSDNESSSSENESEDSESKGNIGDDIDLSNITDLSDNSDSEPSSPKQNSFKRKRQKTSHLFKKNAKGEWPLHVACIKGEIKVVRHLIDQRHPVNVRDNAGWLPLHEAVNHGHLEIVKLLLDNGAWINDRGGSNCDGVTPLHDAATAGQLQVMQLLLDRGALALARTDSGSTVLQELKKWRVRAGPDFRVEEEELYDSLVKRLEEVLEKAGQKDFKLPEKEDAPIFSGFSQSKRESPNLGVLRRKTDLDDNNFDSDNESLANDYKEVMKNLKNRSVVQQKSPKNVPKHSAFVEGDFEDWLIDDMPTKSKKRKISHQSPIHEEEISIPDDFFVEDFEETPKICSNKRKSQISLLDSGFSRTRSITPPNTNLKRTNSNDTIKNRPQQKKLTNFGHTRHIVEADSTSNSDENFTQNSSQNANILTDPTLFVDVKIEGRLFRVPILMSQVQTKNIRWLADEAANRYASKEFMKPTLELETSSGAVLADDDFLNIIFPMGSTQAEQITAKVVKWSLPPLQERYKEACHHLGVSYEEGLCQIIEEMSISLDLSNRGLTSNKTTPLLKALNHQNNLIELNFSGNFLNNASVSMLCSSLVTLHNLNTLNLSCTGLKCGHISLISSVFCDNQNSFEKLCNFDISDNCLTNGCLKDLSTICQHLKLSNLNISNVELSENIPENIKINFETLQCLNISKNKLNTTDLKKIVSWCDLTKLTSLNISKINCLKPLLELFNPDMVLEEFYLSRCQVEDSDLYKLLRLAPNLKVLDLSYNEGLTSISLRRLLEFDSLLRLNSIGCDNIFKYFEYSDGWVINFGKNNNGKGMFKISYDCEENKKNCEEVERLFTDQFVECIVNKYLGFLSVKICR